jgi:hypothetical protein
MRLIYNMSSSLYFIFSKFDKYKIRMYRVQQTRSPNASKREEAIHIVDRMQPPEMNMTTNIKVAVSNRLKSAQMSHPALAKQSRN